MRSNKVGILIFGMFLLLFFHPEIHAQDTLALQQPVCRVDIGAGISGMEELATSLSGEIQWRQGVHLFTLQYVYLSEVNLSIQFFPEIPPPPPEQIRSIGLLYGRTFPFHLKKTISPFPFALLTNEESDYFFTISIGISLCQNVFRYYENDARVKIGDALYTWQPVYSSRKKIVVGIPFQMELAQRLTPTIGVVHRLFYQFDDRRSLWGFQWAIQAYF